MRLTRSVYSRQLLVSSSAAAMLAGECGFGSPSNDCREVSTARTSYEVLHWFCRMSKQMEPSAYTFGWNMEVRNFTAGGLFGYSSVKVMLSLNTPPSNAVSSGPRMTAFHTMMFSSVGQAPTPGGGSFCIICRSFIRRRRAAVDMTLAGVAAYSDLAVETAGADLRAGGCMTALHDREASLEARHRHLLRNALGIRFHYFNYPLSLQLGLRLDSAQLFSTSGLLIASSVGLIASFVGLIASSVGLIASSVGLIASSAGGASCGVLGLSRSQILGRGTSGLACRIVSSLIVCRGCVLRCPRSLSVQFSAGAPRGSPAGSSLRSPSGSSLRSSSAGGASCGVLGLSRFPILCRGASGLACRIVSSLAFRIVSSLIVCRGCVLRCPRSLSVQILGRGASGLACRIVSSLIACRIVSSLIACQIASLIRYNKQFWLQTWPTALHTSTSKTCPVSMAMSRADQPLNAQTEAGRLYKAMKGLGTDEKTIIDVMARRPSHQRAEIARAFKTAYGKELVDAFKSELSGSFYKTCKSLCYVLCEFDAICLREAMEGIGTDEEALIDILTTRSNYQIRAIKEAFERLFHRNLESDVRSETSGDFRKVLVSLLTAGREEGPVRPEAVAADAETLYRAGEGRLGTDEDTLNRLLCSRSPAHVAAVADAYKKKRHRGLQDAIAAETSGDYRNALLSVVSFAEDPARQVYAVSSPCRHVAGMLYRSMKGAGTNDRRLQRTIIGFCESDMPAVKAAFQRQYGESLAVMIRGDTSGDYERVLLTLIGDA
uniref:Annexin n=1 Tax=Macrostomum lignano TaxID=282301 RepID=A0A1I8I777_9PLAT